MSLIRKIENVFSQNEKAFEQQIQNARVVNNQKKSGKRIRVAINGFGRIGRAFVRQVMEEENTEKIQIVAINDLGNIENLAYLLKYDTVYKKADFEIEILEKGIQLDPKHPEIKAIPGKIEMGGNEVVFVSEKNPENLPWKDLAVDVVVESTGLFTKFSDARAHIKAGAKKVVISAPAKDDAVNSDEATILMGINDEKISSCVVTSNASCTTNAASPIIAILDEEIGIEKAVLSTTHGFTASQALVDAPSKKDFREGRAAAQNIVPSTTGAAIAVTKAFPKLNNLFDGISLRVPVPAGSIVDVTFISKRQTTVEEVNNALKAATLDNRWTEFFLQQVKIWFPQTFWAQILPQLQIYNLQKLWVAIW